MISGFFHNFSRRSFRIAERVKLVRKVTARHELEPAGQGELLNRPVGSRQLLWVLLRLADMLTSVDGVKPHRYCEMGKIS